MAAGLRSLNFTLGENEDPRPTPGLFRPEVQAFTSAIAARAAAQLDVGTVGTIAVAAVAAFENVDPLVVVIAGKVRPADFCRLRRFLPFGLRSRQNLFLTGQMVR